jgi:hypothetical protein
MRVNSSTATKITGMISKISSGLPITIFCLSTLMLFSWVPKAQAQADTGTANVTIYRAGIRTVAGYYASAINGGGGNLLANTVRIGVNENFKLIDINNGTLQNGDLVKFMTLNGAYISAPGGGGQTLTATGSGAAWATFRIIKVGATGLIRAGDRFALQSWNGIYSGGNYVAAEGGGNGTFIANRTSISDWETFHLAMEPDPLPTTAILADPYHKLQYYHWKYNSNGPNGSTNCGPASLAMVLKQYYREPDNLTTETSIDYTRHLMFPGRPTTRRENVDVLDADSESSNDADIARGIISAGGTYERLSGWNALNIKLAEGKPCISYGYLDDNWRRQFPGRVGSGTVGHTNCILGRTSDGKYIVADPMHEGGPVEMTQAQLGVFYQRTSGGTPSFTSVAFPEHATFVSMTAPLNMVPNNQYDVTVRMRNAGIYNWFSGSNYRLGSQAPQDNVTWGVARVNLPASVAPLQQVNFNFRVTAPLNANNYGFQWRMLHEGVQWFGRYSAYIPVRVSY